jgi:uncharacterized protein YjbI with pentapeptide repeats
MKKTYRFSFCAALFVLAGCGSPRQMDVAASPADGGAVSGKGAPDAGPPMLPIQDNAMTMALHEQQFAADASLKAHVGDTVVLQLESLMAHLGDSGTVGTDIIPYHVHTAVSHTYCFDDEEGAPRVANILDAHGTEILSILPGECGIVEMPAGEYRLVVASTEAGGTADTPFVFIRPSRFVLAPPAPPVPADETGVSREAVCTAGCASPRSGSAGALKADMKSGETAPFSGDCAKMKNANTRDSDTLQAFGDSCIASAKQISGFILGPQTQVVSYPGGVPSVLKNDDVNYPKVVCVASPYDSSFISSSTSAVWKATCPLAAAGMWCHPVGRGIGLSQCPPAKYDASVVPGEGEITVLGTVDLAAASKATSCCSPAYKFKGWCDDLSLVGFDESVAAVLLGSGQMEARLFSDPYYGGRQTLINVDNNTGSSKDPPDIRVYNLPAAGAVASAGIGTVSSLQVRTVAENNYNTVIQVGWCTGCNLARADFSGQVLTNVHLDGADLTGANLTRTQLTLSSLVNATLAGVNASFVNLSGSDLSGAKTVSTDPTIGRANFSNAFIKDTNLTGANLRTAVFDGANIIDGGSQKTTFDSAQLDDASFVGAVVKGAVFSGATLGNTRFEKAILVGALFKGIRDNGNKPEATNSFNSAVLYGTDFTNSRFDYADFSNALLSFRSGSYLLNAYDHYDTALKNYVSITNAVNYDAGYPDKVPALTTAHTTCPDGQPGPCVGAGGESPDSCQADCASEPACETSWNCAAAPWDPAKIKGRLTCGGGGVCGSCGDATNCGDGICDWLGGETAVTCSKDCAKIPACIDRSQCVALKWQLAGKQGHWECQQGACTPVVDSSTCGNRVCEMNGRWLPNQPPQWAGTNDLHSWSKPVACK